MAESKEISLVTGASGFVGSAVVRRLLAAGHEVRALVRASSDRRNLEGLEIEIAEGDLNDADSLLRAAADCGALFHVAADYRLWTRQPDHLISTNLDGTRNVMAAALKAGIGRIVYTSSVATLGAREDGTVIDELAPVGRDDMIGAYKLSKFLAEQEVRRMVAEEDLPAIIVNPSTPVGPRDIKPTPTGKLVIEAARGKMQAYVDTGLNIVHVEDVAEGHLLAFLHGVIGERYILGGENLTLREIITTIAEVAGSAGPRFRIPLGAVLPIAHLAETWAKLTGGGEPFATIDGVKMARKKMYFSSDKARKNLTYAPRPAGEALGDAVRWYAENGYLD
jgi:dihydroflavonol-4-reductase